VDELKNIYYVAFTSSKQHVVQQTLKNTVRTYKSDSFPKL